MSENEKPPVQENKQQDKPSELPSIDRGEVSMTAITETLRSHGLDLKGGRINLSRGAFGALYKLETEQGVSVVEKTYAKFKKRYQIIETKTNVHGSQDEVHSRLGIVNKETGKVDQVVIDWLYNEERALKNLADIPGIPKTYGAVYDGVRGSILEQEVQGYELALMYDFVESEQEINDIFDRVEEVYTKAAERGYIYNVPFGSTILVDETTKQPYLIDWYNHSSGNIKTENPVSEKFKKGLKDLREGRKMVQEQFAERKLKEVRESIDRKQE